MVEFKARQHRLEIPPAPQSDDPAVQKKYSNDLRRLVMDEFNRLASDFYDFKQATYNAGVIPLRGATNIIVTRDQYTMSAVWENPQQDAIEPTHVRVRIKEITPNAWATYTYPISAWSFNGLQPNTQYTLEVQLIALFESTDTFVSTTRNCPSVPVLRTAESEIRAKVFTTLAGVGPPTATPANDTNVTFNFPTTEGTPGAVDSADCWWGYKFQYQTPSGWADTAVFEAFAAGNVGDVPIDTNTAPFTTHPNAWFRVAYREICNAVPQPWVYGNPFMAVDFANADCAGIVKSASLTTAPFDTADMFAIPGVCQSSGEYVRITNELTDLALQPNEPGFGTASYLSSEWTLIADDTSIPAVSNTIYTSLLSGTVAAVATLNDSSDFVVNFDIRVQNNALVLAGGTGPYEIVNIGEKIKFNIIQGLSTFSVTVTIPRDGGGQYLFRADDLSYADWHNVYYYHDVSEATGRQLIVDNSIADQSANAFLNDFNGITNTIQISATNSMQIRSLYGWKSLVNLETVWQAPEPIGLSHAISVTTAISTITFGVPAGVAANDVAVVKVNIVNSVLFAGTGWTSVGEVASGFQVLYRVCDGTESGSFPDLTRADVNVTNGVLGLWRGIDLSNPVETGTHFVGGLNLGSDAYFDAFTKPVVRGGVQWASGWVGAGTNVPEVRGVRSSGWGLVAPVTNRQASIWRSYVHPASSEVQSPFWFINNNLGTVPSGRFFRGITLKPRTPYSGITVGTITQVGTSTASGNSTNPTVALPAGVQTGDYLYFCLTSVFGIAPSTDVNQSFLQGCRMFDPSNPSTGFHSGAIITGTPPTDITVTLGSGRWRASVVVYRGVDPVAPTDFYGYNWENFTSGITQPPLTTRFNDSLVISCLTAYRSSGSAAVILLPANVNGYSVAVARLGTTGIGADHWIYDRTQAVAGPVAQMTGTFQGGGVTRMWNTVALRAANSQPA